MFGTNSEPWMADGLCLQVGPSIFFPNDGENGTDAKRVCLDCPVRQACLEYALANNERFGIWAGLTYGQRVKERRRRERAA